MNINRRYCEIDSRELWRIIVLLLLEVVKMAMDEIKLNSMVGIDEKTPLRPTGDKEWVSGGELLGAPDANLNAKNSIVITVFRVMFVSSIVPLQDLNRNGH